MLQLLRDCECGRLHSAAGGSAYASARPDWMSMAHRSIGAGGDTGIVADEARSAGIDVDRSHARVRSETGAVIGGERGVDIQQSSGTAVASVKPAHVHDAICVGSDCRHQALACGRIVHPDGAGEGQAA